MHRNRLPPSSTRPQANGHMSARNIASASRKGAGGNAVPHNPSAASYSLWSARDMPTANTLTGNIALVGRGAVLACPLVHAACCSKTALSACCSISFALLSGRPHACARLQQVGESGTAWD